MFLIRHIYTSLRLFMSRTHNIASITDLAIQVPCSHWYRFCIATEELVSLKTYLCIVNFSTFSCNSYYKKDMKKFSWNPHQNSLFPIDFLFFFETLPTYRECRFFNYLCKNMFWNKFATKKASTTSTGCLQNNKTKNLFGFYIYLFHLYIICGIGHNQTTVLSIVYLF